MTEAAILAFDRLSARQKDVDGRLHVTGAHISKATVNPYRGSEIPGYEELSLDPDRVYQMFRPPDELAKAASTFAGLQILSAHEGVDANSVEKKRIVAGAVGTDVTFNDPYLDASLTFWWAPDIADIETGKKCQLSCAYRYKPIMEPGEYQGLKFDGRMTELEGNHLALVTAGRAGSDVTVADSLEGFMAEPLTSRKALMVRGAIAAHVGPLLRSGSRLAYDAILADVTRESWGAQKPRIIQTVITRAMPMLAQDAKLDADALKLALDKADEDEDGAEDDDMEAMDAEMSEEEREEEKKARAEDRKGGMGAKDRKKAMDARKMSRDAKKAKDEEDDKKDEMSEKKEAEDARRAKDKKAMDAAISSEVTKAEQKIVARMTAVAQAREDVRPWIGNVAIAMDSAPAVYKLALDHLKVDLDGVPESAYGAVLKTQPKPGARTDTLAMDAAVTGTLDAKFPSLNRIGMA